MPILHRLVLYDWDTNFKGDYTFASEPRGLSYLTLFGWRFRKEFTGNNNDAFKKQKQK